MNIPKPLRPWAWCGVWLIIIWSGLVVLDRTAWLLPDGQNPQAQTDRFLQLLADFNADSGPPVKILALGDSILSASLSDSEDFSGVLDGNMKLLPLYSGAARWTHFAALMSEFRSTKPQLIIVQDSLLQKTSLRPTALESALLNARRLAASYIRSTRNKLIPQDIPFTLRQWQAIKRGEYSASIPIAPEALEFLAELQAVSNAVVVIHLPRSLAVEPVPETTDWIKHLQSKLEPMNIPVIVLGGPLPNDHYDRDQVHPNDQGRVVRRKQFRDFVREQLP